MPHTVKELIDIAIGIEETGYEFYTGCAIKFADISIRDIFEFLAREEMEHKKLFQSFHGKGEPSGLFTEEYFAYLRAIGGGRIFETNEETMSHILAEIATPIDAVKHAFAAEKDSILFYSELKELYKNDNQTTSLLNRIIDEERKHVATLLDLLEKIRFAS